MKKTLGILILISLVISMRCSRTTDLSGTYKKALGDYRYDTIVLKKVGENKYSITIMHEGEKKLSAISALEERTLTVGWLSTITVKDDNSQLRLNVGKGTVFTKQKE